MDKKSSKLLWMCYKPDCNLLMMEYHNEQSIRTADTGAAGTGTADTGTADTGTADTGTADTGTADTRTATIAPAGTAAA